MSRRAVAPQQRTHIRVKARTCGQILINDAECQDLPCADAATWVKKPALFDYFVGAPEQHLRDFEPRRAILRKFSDCALDLVEFVRATLVTAGNGRGRRPWTSLSAG